MHGVEADLAVVEHVLLAEGVGGDAEGVAQAVRVNAGVRLLVAVEGIVGRSEADARDAQHLADGALEVLRLARLLVVADRVVERPK